MNRCVDNSIAGQIGTSAIGRTFQGTHHYKFWVLRWKKLRAALPLDQPFEDFLAARPKDLRRNLRRYREKAEAIGCVKFEVSHTADDQLMDALIALHRARWEQMGEVGMIEANRSEAFLREVAKLLASRGALRIFTVRFGDCVAAILLALCNKTTIFSYLSAFDPQHESLGSLPCITEH